MNKQTKRGRASPWFIFSALCFIALIVVIAVFLNLQYSAQSVVPNPNKHTIECKQETGGEYDELFPEVDWDYWLSVNPALVGWVTVPGTAIDYAIVQAPDYDPTYYLNHDIFQNWNPAGCPYVDAACNGFESPNTYIFGHNMNYNDMMFADFAKFSNESFSAEHPLILLQTPEQKIVLCVSSVGIVNGHEKSKRIEFDSASNLQSWYREKYSSTVVQVDNDVEMTQLFTFVTCSYNYFASERTLVYAQPQQERIAHESNTD